MTAPLLRAQNLKRHYTRGGKTIRALDGVDLSIEAGEFVALVGASGSGKSTLLSLLAGLDSPTEGSMEVEGRDLARASRRERARYRAERVGMVFQAFHLIRHKSALANVELALYFSDLAPSKRRQRARQTLERLGLGERLEHRPHDLSGGEQQRVALARALVKQPSILFADEPTGNLDQEATDGISSLLQELNGEGLTVVMVTHDQRLAAELARRSHRLRYGRFVENGQEER